MRREGKVGKMSFAHVMSLYINKKTKWEWTDGRKRRPAGVAGDYERVMM